MVFCILTSLCSKRFAETGNGGRRGGWVANSSKLRGVRERGKYVQCHVAVMSRMVPSPFTLPPPPQGTLETSATEKDAAL